MEIRKRYSVAEQEMAINLYKESGLTQAEFCQREGIALSSLQRWQAKRRIKNAETTGAGARFVEVAQPSSRQAESGISYRLGSPAGLWLEFGSHFDARQVRELAAILLEAGRC